MVARTMPSAHHNSTILPFFFSQMLEPLQDTPQLQTTSFNVSKCLVERGITQWTLLLFNEMQISCRVFCNLALDILHSF